MSIAHDIPFDSTLGHLPVPQVPVSSDKRPLHRIADVRRRQGISVRSAARRMHTSIDQVRRQEEPANDMLLSELLRWQQALDVPLADLVGRKRGAALGAGDDPGSVAADHEDGAGHQGDGDQLVDPAVRDDARAAARGIDAGAEGRGGVAFDRPTTFAERIGPDGRARAAGYVLSRFDAVGGNR